MIKRSILVCLGALLLAACGSTGNTPSVPNIPPAPVVVADQTKLDEQVGLTLTLAYTAAAKAASLAISTGLIKDPATIKRIGELDTRAYAAVEGVRAAYLAGNAANYLAAIAEARRAIAAITSAIRVGPSGLSGRSGGDQSLATADQPHAKTGGGRG